MITLGFALFGAIVAGILLLVSVQEAIRQSRVGQRSACCPLLPPGQHHTGCTAVVRDA